jgi:nucleotide-binding universal stress UspA family protein
LAYVGAALADEAQLETYAELRAVLGPLAPGLAQVAVTEPAYLVVVGCRGRSPLKAAILGSVSQELIRLSPCPVVIAPRSLIQVRTHAEPESADAGSRS